MHGLRTTYNVQRSYSYTTDRCKIIYGCYVPAHKPHTLTFSICTKISFQLEKIVDFKWLNSNNKIKFTNGKEIEKHIRHIRHIRAFVHSDVVYRCKL